MKLIYKVLLTCNTLQMIFYVLKSMDIFVELENDSHLFIRTNIYIIYFVVIFNVLSSLANNLHHLCRTIILCREIRPLKHMNCPIS